MADYPFHVDPRAIADPGSELSIQSRFRGRMKMLAPTVRIFAVPNAGRRTQWEALRAKQEGMVAGIPDCVCLWPGGTAWIEFKAKTGTLSKAQEEWLTWLHKAGHICGVFRAPDTAVAFLRAAGAPFLFAEAA